MKIYKYKLKENNKKVFIEYLFEHKLEIGDKVQLILPIKENNHTIISIENSKKYKVIEELKIIDGSIDYDAQLLQCNSDIPTEFLSDYIQMRIQETFGIIPYKVSICNTYDNYLFIFIYLGVWNRLNLLKNNYE